MEDLTFGFFPIISLNSEKPIQISGIALAEGIWKNVIYSPEEIEKATADLVGKPIKIEHGMDKEFGSKIVGKVIEALFDKILKAIKFKADIEDPIIKERILAGAYKAVSMSTFMEKIPTNDESIKEGIDFTFTELSLVKNPACEKCFIFHCEQLSKQENTDIGEKMVNESNEIIEENGFGDASFPDDCFAWVPESAKGPNGNKSDRKLPYKNADGTVDLDHVRNALARLDQTDGIPPEDKEKIRTMLQGILAKENPDYNPSLELSKEEVPKAKEVPKVEVPKIEPKVESKIETPKVVEAPKIEVPKEEPKIVEVPKVEVPKEEVKIETPKEEVKKEEPKISEIKEEKKDELVVPIEQPKVETIVDPELEEIKVAYPKYYEQYPYYKTQTYPIECPSCGNTFDHSKDFFGHWTTEHDQLHGKFEEFNSKYKSYYPSYAKYPFPYDYKYRNKSTIKPNLEELNKIFRREVTKKMIELFDSANAGEKNEYTSRPHLLFRQASDEVLFGHDMKLSVMKEIAKKEQPKQV